MIECAASDRERSYRDSGLIHSEVYRWAACSIWIVCVNVRGVDSVGYIELDWQDRDYVFVCN